MPQPHPRHRQLDTPTRRLHRWDFAVQVALVALGYLLAAGCHAGAAVVAALVMSAIAQLGRRRARLLADLQGLATRDPLTGIWNRRTFDELLAAEHARSRRHGHPLSLLLIDLDHFKHVNDRHGHAAGDQALRQACELIAGHVRGSDVFARVGGEELALLAPETTPEQAATLAEGLRALVHETTREQPIALTISIGVAGADGRTAAEVLTAADEALYEAKRGGRNRVVTAAQVVASGGSAATADASGSTGTAPANR